MQLIVESVDFEFGCSKIWPFIMILITAKFEISVVNEICEKGKFVIK